MPRHRPQPSSNEQPNPARCVIVHRSSQTRDAHLVTRTGQAPLRTPSRLPPGVRFRPLLTTEIESEPPHGGPFSPSSLVPCRGCRPPATTVGCPAPPTARGRVGLRRTGPCPAWACLVRPSSTRRTCRARRARARTRTRREGSRSRHRRRTVTRREQAALERQTVTAHADHGSGRSRRLAKLFENTTASATGWLQVACIATTLRHLSRARARGPALALPA